MVPIGSSSPTSAEHSPAHASSGPAFPHSPQQQTYAPRAKTALYARGKGFFACRGQNDFVCRPRLPDPTGNGRRQGTSANKLHRVSPAGEVSLGVSRKAPLNAKRGIFVVRGVTCSTPNDSCRENLEEWGQSRPQGRKGGGCRGRGSGEAGTIAAAGREAIFRNAGSL